MENSIQDMEQMAGVSFNSPINTDAINSMFDKIQVLKQHLKNNQNLDALTNIKSKIEDKSLLLKPGEIYEAFVTKMQYSTAESLTSPEEIDKRDDARYRADAIMFLLQQSFKRREIDLDDMLDMFGNDYDTLVKTIFEDGVDFIDGQFEMKEVPEAECRKFIGLLNTSEMCNGSVVFCGNHKFEPKDCSMLSMGTLTNMQMTGDMKPRLMSFVDNNYFAKGYDIIYRDNIGVITFRVVNDKIALMIGVGEMFRINFIEINYLNEPVSFYRLFDEDIDHIKTCALALSDIREKNTLKTKTLGLYDTFKMFGMTKYEQIGFIASALRIGLYNFEEYGRVDARLLNSLKNGIPEELCALFDITSDNVVTDLLNKIDSYKVDEDDEEDQNIQVIINTVKLYCDILTEKFEPEDSIYEASLIDSHESTYDIAVAISHYIKTVEPTADMNAIHTAISQTCQVFETQDKLHHFISASLAYGIISHRISSAKFVLFANDVIRECSFNNPDKQRHLGFNSTVISLAALQRQCDMQRRIAAGGQFSFELGNIITGFCDALDRSEKLDTPYIDMLKKYGNIIVYYLLQYCYYRFKRDTKAIQSLPISITNADEENHLILFDLNKIIIPVADEILQIKLHKSVLDSFSAKVEQSIKSCNTNALSNKTDKNFMSTYDYLKLQFSESSDGVSLDFFCANLMIDYDNIVNADKTRQIKTLAITNPKGLGLSPFYRLGDGLRGSITTYIDTPVSSKFDELEFMRQDAITIVESQLDGSPQVGSTECCVPGAVYYKKFIRDCYLSGKKLNHMKTLWDLNSQKNKDLMMNLGYNIYTDANFDEDLKIESVEVLLNPQQELFKQHCVDKLTAQYEKTYHGVTPEESNVIDLEATFLAINCFDDNIISKFDKLMTATLAQKYMKEEILAGKQKTQELVQECNTKAETNIKTLSSEEMNNLKGMTYDLCMNSSSFSLPLTTVIEQTEIIKPRVTVPIELASGLKTYLEEHRSAVLIGDQGVYWNDEIYSLFDKNLLDNIGFKVAEDRYIIRIQNRTYNLVLREEVEF